MAKAVCWYCNSIRKLKRIEGAKDTSVEVLQEIAHEELEP